MIVKLTFRCNNEYKREYKTHRSLLKSRPNFKPYMLGGDVMRLGLGSRTTKQKSIKCLIYKLKSRNT